MMGRSIEGVIIATARRDDPIVDECEQNGIPFVFVNRTVDRDGVNAIIVDEDFGMRSVIDHLLGLKHERIAYIAGPQQTSTGYRRAKVFSDYLRIHNLPAKLVETTEKFTIEEGRRALRRLLERGSEFTAVAAGNDLLGAGMHGCIEGGRTQGAERYFYRWLRRYGVSRAHESGIDYGTRAQI